MFSYNGLIIYNITVRAFVAIVFTRQLDFKLSHWSALSSLNPQNRWFEHVKIFFWILNLCYILIQEQNG